MATLLSFCSDTDRNILRSNFAAQGVPETYFYLSLVEVLADVPVTEWANLFDISHVANPLSCKVCESCIWPKVYMRLKSLLEVAIGLPLKRKQIQARNKKWKSWKSPFHIRASREKGYLDLTEGLCNLDQNKIKTMSKSFFPSPNATSFFSKVKKHIAARDALQLGYLSLFLYKLFGELNRLMTKNLPYGTLNQKVVGTLTLTYSVA